MVDIIFNIANIANTILTFNRVNLWQWYKIQQERSSLSPVRIKTTRRKLSPMSKGFKKTLHVYISLLKIYLFIYSYKL